MYLNHAAIGVLPIAARDVMRDFVDAHARQGVIGTARFEGMLEPARRRLARFLGAAPGEVALLSNTSEAANILARGLRWQPGDEVLINDNEFGSNALPWLALHDEGVTVKMIATSQARMTPGVLARAMTDRTKVVALSWVSFTDGYRHDLAELAEVAHARGALIAVDAIQGLGGFPLDAHASDLDAVYGGTQKWLLGQPGLGYLHVRRELMERMRVRLPGWRSVENIWNFLDYEQPYAAGAERFEAGTPNLIAIAAMIAALDVLDSADAAARAAHILNLTDHLIEQLRRRDAVIQTIRSATESSGIVTFTLPNVDPLETGKHLAAAGVIVTARPTGIRISPHAYNTIDDIDAALAAL